MQFVSSLLPKSPANLLNPDEVDANRRGEITPAQNDRLNAMALGRQGCGTFIAPMAVLSIIFFYLFTSLLSSGGITWFFLLPLAFLLAIILGLSKGLYSWWRNSTKLKADRANGVVRSGVGDLNFLPKKGFVANVGEENLILSASDDASGLMPGVRYNFYYLPESRFVLSAEQVGEISAGQVRLALSDILARANNFSAEDLQANQNGEIAQSQQMAGLKKLIPGLIMLGFALVFGIFFLLPLLANSKLSSNLIPILFIGGFLAVFSAIGFSMVLNTFLDFKAGVPEMVDGVGQKITRRKSSGRSSRTVYYYIIGNQEFEVPQKAYPALIEGLNYKAYFLPRTKRLLTIEPTSIPQSVGL
jgi:hypothetical protein